MASVKLASVRIVDIVFFYQKEIGEVQNKM